MELLSIAFDPSKDVLRLRVIANIVEDDEFNPNPVVIYETSINLPENCWDVILEVDEGVE